MARPLVIYHNITPLKARDTMHVYCASRIRFTPQELLDADIVEVSSEKPPRVVRGTGDMNASVPYQRFIHLAELGVLYHKSHYPYPQIYRRVKNSVPFGEEWGEGELSEGGQGLGVIFDFKAYKHLMQIFPSQQEVSHVRALDNRKAMLEKAGRSTPPYYRETLSEAFSKISSRLRELSVKHGLKLPADFPEE